MASLEENKKVSLHACFINFLLITNLIPAFFVGAVLDPKNQAFIQTDEYLTYVIGDINGIPLQVTSNDAYSVVHFSDSSGRADVELDPPYLDFDEQSIGVPNIKQVTIRNLNTRINLHLLSISGDSTHFHCSFFREKLLPPGANTTMDVVFVARHQGSVENTLYIHTSQGSISYSVFGTGATNSYRLRSFIGVRVPVNSTFTPSITIHNPYSSTLQVLEMYSNTGDLHLELPTDVEEGTRDLWAIRPYETKVVMRACFVGRAEFNHTAYIRIRTNHTDHRLHFLLPFEVQVSSDPGLYSPLDLLDFGVLYSNGEPRSLTLDLINTGGADINISSVDVSPPNGAIVVSFRSSNLQSDPYVHHPVALITFTPSKAYSQKQSSGTVIVKSNGHHQLSIPFKANIVQGLLSYNLNMTYFFSAIVLHNVSRLMTFTNLFLHTVVIYNITLPKKYSHIFSIHGFWQPVSIKPNQTQDLFQLKFHPDATQLHFNLTLLLLTNISLIHIPVIVYNGKLQFEYNGQSIDKNSFDLGTLKVDGSYNVLFTLENNNPVEVVFGELSTEMRGASVKFVRYLNGGSIRRPGGNTSSSTKPLIIKPHQKALFNLKLTTPRSEGTFQSQIFVMTQFQDLIIPITLKTAEGSLKTVPDLYIMKNSYPGRTQFKVLKLHSSFKQPMELKSVQILSNDSCFAYLPTHGSNISLRSQTETIIGRLYYSPVKTCGNKCYTGLGAKSSSWLSGLRLQLQVPDVDQQMYTQLRKRWTDLVTSHQTMVNVTAKVDTNLVQGFTFSAHAQLHWPQIARKFILKFPLTQIGNKSVSDFIVENLGDDPVVLQILPVFLYPSPKTLIDLLDHRLSEIVSGAFETQDTGTFTLLDLQNQNESEGNSSSLHQQQVESLLGVRVHPETIVRILKPGEKLRVYVGFRPLSEELKSSLIIIRNNLTVLEAVVVQGQGGHGEMRFSNTPTSTPSTLLFEMTPNHLKNCHKKTGSKFSVPNFTVRRSFPIRNVGNLQLYVHNFSINGLTCEGYGFRVLDCSGFSLPPNTTRKVDIAFTPDFTLSRVRRELVIHTSLRNATKFILLATIPVFMLEHCATNLPRPNWEPVLYCAFLCMMTFLIFCIFIASYFEADRIFVADIVRRKLRTCVSSQAFDKDKVFDLNNFSHLILSPTYESEHRAELSQSLKSDLSLLKLQSAARARCDKQKEIKPHILSKCTRLILRACTLSLALFTSNQQECHINSPQPDIISEPIYPTENVHHNESSLPQSVCHNSTSKNANKSQVLNSNGCGPYTSSNTKSKRSKPLRVQDTNDTAYRRQARDEKRLSGEGAEKYRSSQKKVDPVITIDDVSLISAKINNNRASNQKHEKPQRKVLPNVLNPKTSIKEKPSKKEFEKDDKDVTTSIITDVPSLVSDEKVGTIEDTEPGFVEAKQMSKMKNKKLEEKVIAYVTPLCDDTYSEDDFVLSIRSKSHKKTRKDAQSPPVQKQSLLGIPCKSDTKFIDDPVKGPAFSSDQKSPRVQTVDKLNNQNKVITSIMKQSAGNTERNPFDNETHIRLPNLSPGSRSSSYSSIVSNEAELPSPITKGIDSPQNPSKIISDVKEMASPETNVNSVIGLPSVPSIANGSNTNLKNNAWNFIQSPNNRPNLGLQSIPESAKLPPVEPVRSNVPYTPVDRQFSARSSSFGYGGLLDTFQTTPTMMQELQAERRRRLMEYQTRVLKEDWPGFSTTALPSESLWDDDRSPVVPRPSEVQTSLTSSNSLWGNNVSNWTTTNSIWTPNKDQNLDGRPNIFMDRPQHTVRPESTATDSVDPFQRWRDIWGAPNEAHSKIWGSPSPLNEPQNM